MLESLVYPCVIHFAQALISKENIEKQQANFANLLAQLENADNNEKIELALSKREVVNPEPELTSDIINRLKTKIQNKES